MPDVPVTIQPTNLTDTDGENNPIMFNCYGESVPLFIATNDFSVENITITNCTSGINSYGGNLQVIGSEISHMNIGIISGSETTNLFLIISSTFYECSQSVNVLPLGAIDTINIEISFSTFSSSCDHF